MPTIRFQGVEIEVASAAEIPGVLAAMGLSSGTPVPAESEKFGTSIHDMIEEFYRSGAYVASVVTPDPDPDPDPDDDPEPAALASVSPIGPVERIPVMQNLLDVLNVVLAFPEGISAKGIGQLLPITEVKPTAVGNRLYRLKLMGLVERTNGHWVWQATQRARNAKLIAA